MAMTLLSLCVCVVCVLYQVVTKTVMEIGNAMQDSDLALPFNIDAGKLGKLTELPFQVGSLPAPLQQQQQHTHMYMYTVCLNGNLLP